MTITFTGDYQTGTIDDAFQSLDPTETYLRTNQDPSAKDATAYSLASLGLTAGTWVYMSVEGDYDAGNGSGDVDTYMTGVFSDSDTLLDSTNLNRVSGAVNAGNDAGTSSTSVGALATDIGEDFGITTEASLVYIPLTATHLFLSVHEDFFGDNTDPDGDFGIRISTPLLVGHTADGTMDISGEAVVAPFVHLGAHDDANGTVYIDAGGTLTAETLILGGKASVDSGLSAFGSGYLTVTGAGSQVIMSPIAGEGVIELGQSWGQGTLVILDGAQVLNSGANAVTLVASGENSGHSWVGVDGAGSLLDAGALLTLGAYYDPFTGQLSEDFGLEAGSGFLQVSNGGQVIADLIATGGGSIISGDSLITGDFLVGGGIFEPGTRLFGAGEDAISTLTIDGDIAIAPSFPVYVGYQFNIDGASVGMFDQLLVTGDLDLGNSSSFADHEFNFSFGANAGLVAGDEMEIITAGSVSGTTVRLAVSSFDAPADFSYGVAQTANGIKLLALNSSDTGGIAVLDYSGEPTAGISVSAEGFEQELVQVVDGAGNHGSFVNVDIVRGTSFADTFAMFSDPDFPQPYSLDIQIDGGGGDDVITSGDGNDVLSGGTGADAIDGGAGNDTADYSGSALAVKASLVSLAGWGAGDSAGDTLANIENLTGSAGDDLLIGDGLANILTGGDGVDDLRGNAGDDIIIGGLGADLLAGGGGNDTLDYSSSALAIAVSLNGGIGFGVGDSAGDTVSGFENVIGSAGNDTADYSLALSIVKVNLGGGVGFSPGDAAGDTYVSIENAIGGAFNDLLIGDGVANILSGGDGNDDIRGYAGDDTLSGDGGNDLLNGGFGNDTFVFADGSGADTVVGFVAGAGSLDDVADIAAFGFADFAAVQAAMTSANGGADTLLQLDVDDSILFEGVAMASFDSGDFVITV